MKNSKNSKIRSKIKMSNLKKKINSKNSKIRSKIKTSNLKIKIVNI